MKALAIAVILLAACGDDGGGARPDAPAASPDADTRDILVRLNALPGVTATEHTPTHAPHGDRYFTLQFTQPVDHDNPGGPTFQQEVSFLHHDLGAPMILATSGYEEGYLDHPADLTVMLSANQVSVEHRFFGTSIPAAADRDWTKLTIEQMAADEHAIVAALSTIYGGKWVATGASKGGMTAAFFHRFYPDDLAGSVSYVAPLSFAIPDARYLPQFDTIGTTACRAKVKDLATELLHNRRAQMLALAQAQADDQGYAYTRIAIGPAVESAIRDLEWTYWQYYGLSFCDTLPDTTADDQTLFDDVLDYYSGINFSDDESTASFEAYFYQAYWQLGSPGTADVRGDSPPTQLAPYVTYAASDYAGSLPQGTPIPTYDPAPMADIDSWVKASGAHMIFVYGQDDPWSGGAFTLGSGSTDSMEAVVAGGTHGSQIADLAPTDRDAALAKLAAWTGVTPVLPDPAKRIRPGRYRRTHPL